MGKQKLSEKLSKVLKENTMDSEEDILKGIVGIAGDIVDEEGSTTDLLYDPKNKEMIEFKVKAGGESDPLVNFIPLKDFKPNVYGLDDAVFDQIEQFGTEVPPIETGADEVSSIEDVSTEEIPSDELDITNSSEELEDDEIEDLDITGEENEEDIFSEPTEPVESEENENENEDNISYEEDKGFKDGKKITAAEDDVTFTESDFNNIPNDILLEYAWSKGIEFTTRKDTINRLFEHGKVSKEDLVSFKEGMITDKVNEVVNEVEDLTDDFIAKFGEDLDFRDFSSIMVAGPKTEVYEVLNNMDEDTWEDYQEELAHCGTTIEYDSLDDQFIVSNMTGESEKDEERF